jgi:hypothetical protein
MVEKNNAQQGFETEQRKGEKQAPDCESFLRKLATCLVKKINMKERMVSLYGLPHACKPGWSGMTLRNSEGHSNKEDNYQNLIKKQQQVGAIRHKGKK